MMLKLIFLLILGISITHISYAEVYKHVDEQGNTYYNNNPDPINNNPQDKIYYPTSETKAQAPAPSPTLAIPKPSTPINIPGFNTPSQPYVIAIQQPKSLDTITTDIQALTVTVSVQPELQQLDFISIFVDGIESKKTNLTTITLDAPLERGEHSLQAKIIVDPNSSRKNASSGVITIYQRRSSKL